MAAVPNSARHPGERQREKEGHRCSSGDAGPGAGQPRELGAPQAVQPARSCRWRRAAKPRSHPLSAAQQPRRAAPGRHFLQPFNNGCSSPDTRGRCGIPASAPATNDAANISLYTAPAPGAFGAPQLSRRGGPTPTPAGRSHQLRPRCPLSRPGPWGTHCADGDGAGGMGGGGGQYPVRPGIGGAACSGTARTKRGPAGSDFAGRQQGNALLNLLISLKAGGQSRGPARPARGRRPRFAGCGQGGDAFNTARRQ